MASMGIIARRRSEAETRLQSNLRILHRVLGIHMPAHRATPARQPEFREMERLEHLADVTSVLLEKVVELLKPKASLLEDPEAPPLGADGDRDAEDAPAETPHSTPEEPEKVEQGAMKPIPDSPDNSSESLAKIRKDAERPLDPRNDGSQVETHQAEIPQANLPNPATLPAGAAKATNPPVKSGKDKDK